MPRITKVTTGEANFVLEEKFEDEVKAEQGRDPISSDVKDIEIKIDNIKWKKSDDWSTLWFTNW